MMSNICFMSEKLKCSIGCFVVSAEEVEGKSILNIVIIQRVVLDELQYKSLHLRSRTDNRSMKNQKASPGGKGRKLAVCFGYNCDFNHCRLAKVLAIVFNLLKHFTTYIFTSLINIFFKFDKYFFFKILFIKD